MKIECVKETFEQAVKVTEKISGKNASLPILSCLYLEAKGNELKIKATNLDLGIEFVIPVRVEQEGTVAIQASVISSFLTGITDQNLKLELKEGSLLINSNKNKANIKTFPVDDFPIIPTVSDEVKIEVNAKDFIKGLKSVWYCASVSGIKPELSSVYVYCEEGYVVFAATDSFRLAERKIKVKKDKDFSPLLIPYRNVPEIIRTLETAKDNVVLAIQKNQISLSFEGVYLVSRVVDGIFPDYRQIIPKENKTTAIVLKQDLVNSVKLSNIFSDKFNQIHFSIESDKEKIEITTKNNDIGEIKHTIEGNVEGESIEINFNQKYISDSFQSIDSESISLGFNSQNKPLLIRSVSDNSFLYLVMPMNR